MIKSPPPLQIQTWPIDQLVFYARNPRKNDAAVDRMCTSIREFGFAVAMLCRSTGEIVDGHLRFKGARKIGLSELPVVLLRSLVRGAGASIQAAGQPLRRLGRVG